MKHELKFRKIISEDYEATYLIDFDFPQTRINGVVNKDVRLKYSKFRREVKAILHGNLREHEATDSVIQTKDSAEADRIYDLAIKNGANVCLRICTTLKKHKAQSET